MRKSKRVGQAYRGRTQPVKVKPNKLYTKLDQDQLRLFWYWINERHLIYLKRRANRPWPWTKNKILRKYKFTNVYRQLDRVTQEWTKRCMSLMCMKARPPELLFHCAMFRLFNWPPTYDTLRFGMGRWRLHKAIALLDERLKSDDDRKHQLFTGAYIIPSGGSTDPKHETICRALDWLYDNRGNLTKRIMIEPSMEKATNLLQNIFTVGPFIAYEIACDLRFTKVLADASDVNSWANPGPGAKRGIHRLLTGYPDWEGPKPNYIERMRELLDRSRKSLRKSTFDCEWPFELREIEHSLCEYDKFARLLYKEGKVRSKFVPPHMRPNYHD